MKKHMFILLFLLTAITVFCLEITVLDYQNNPLADASVAIIELNIEHFTDTQGKAVFSGVQPGEYTIVAILPGYEKLTRNVSVTKGGEKLVLQLNPLVIEVQETTITEKRNKGEVTAQTTIREEDMDNSTQSVLKDVASIVKTMPGVSSSGDSFDNDMFIQGGSQDEWVARMDGVYITNPSRWGGRITMFNPTNITSLDLYTAGYPAKFDQGLAGILDISIKQGNTSSWSGFADMSAASAELMLQGPLSDSSSIYFNTRRTWYDLIMPLVLPEEEMQGIQFPYLWDAVCKISYNITPQDSLYFLGYVSYEGMTMRMDMELVGEDEDEGKFTYEMLYAIASVRYLHSFNDKDYMESILAVVPQFGQGDFTESSTEGSHWGFGGSYLEVFQYFYINSLQGHRITLGAGCLTGYYDGGFESWYSAFDNNQNWIRIDQGTDYDSFMPLFGVVNLTDDWELLPHLIFQVGIVANGYLNNNEMNIMPRGGLKYELTPELDIFVRGGMYNLYSFDLSYLDNDYGNPDLQSSKAVHAIGGLDFSNDDFLFLIEGFYKYYYDLPMYDIELNYNNNGIRHTAGFDVYLQKKARKDGWINGWISYTYVYAREMVSDRTPEAAGEEPYVEPVGEWYTPGYLSDHTLSVVLELTYRKNQVTPIFNWLDGCKLSFDFRLLSGKPYTPATGVDMVDIGGGVFHPDFHYGDYNSESLPLIYKLDIKITMPFSIFSLLNLCGLDVTSSSYISFINVLNNRNVYEYYYDVDQSNNLVRKEVRDFPFMILGGMRVEF